MVFQPPKTNQVAAIQKFLFEKYKFSDSISVASDIERILNGEPLDYVIGWVPFLGAAIDLSLKPFIPRPETEYWASEAIKDIKKRKGKAIRILDVFSGSGCIGVAILESVPEVHVTFAEKNPRFIEQIKINLKKNNCPENRFQVFRSDVFQAIKGQFDVIVANPPYVGMFSRLDKEVKKYEPKIAYHGGKNGLSAISRFLKSAKLYLEPEGQIWMEFGSWQQSEIRKILTRFGYRDFSFHKDQYGRPRYVIV
ncbi:MAG: HemK/PrmC family methyltransferase [bacterium]|nr:HemK/PrmC family methyltransferase [bacterium]